MPETILFDTVRHTPDVAVYRDPRSDHTLCLWKYADSPRPGRPPARHRFSNARIQWIRDAVPDTSEVLTWCMVGTPPETLRGRSYGENVWPDLPQSARPTGALQFLIPQKAD